MREVEIVGVRVEMPSNQPIVLLHEAVSERYVPIWIGAVEATAIAFAQQGVVPPRPLTHDLLKDVIVASGNDVAEVRIQELRDGVFFATLVFGSGVEVSARPSDAIALALRTNAPVLCADEILDEVGIQSSDIATTESGEDAGQSAAGGDSEAAAAPVSEQEVRRFREFLDQITPEDFDETDGQS